LLNCNIGQLLVSRERRDWEFPSAECLTKGGVQFGLYVGGKVRDIPERVEEGPIVVANVEGEEVSCGIVPRPTCRGDEGEMGILRAGKVSHACPPRGGFA
jgi:hypothetical protein